MLLIEADLLVPIILRSLRSKFLQPRSLSFALFHDITHHHVCRGLNMIVRLEVLNAGLMDSLPTLESFTVL